jgi:hypothetical protein
MKCPDCGRPLPAGKARCLYCGAAANSAGPETASSPRSAGPGSPTDQSETQVRLDDLPEDLRRQVLHALHSQKTDAAAEENAPRPPEAPMNGLPAEADEMPGVLKALESIRQSFQDDRIDYDEYRELVLQNLYRFLDGLDPKAALGFVLNDLKHSDLGRFVDDAIYKSLCRAQLSAAVPPVEKIRPWAFGIFRKKRKSI